MTKDNYILSICIVRTAEYKRDIGGYCALRAILRRNQPRDFFCTRAHVVKIVPMDDEMNASLPRRTARVVAAASVVLASLSDPNFPPFRAALKVGS
jgi:hypothetical protein